MQIDVKDRKILYELSQDARMSATALAKKVGISREVAKYRISKLIERGIVKDFITVIDTEQLGFRNYLIALELQNTTPAKEKEIIDFLKSTGLFHYIAASTSRWDLVVRTNAKNMIHLHTITRKLSNKFPKNIKKVHTTIVLQEWINRFNFLIKKKELPFKIKLEYHVENIKPAELDKTDFHILKQLSSGARKNAVEIASKIGISADTVHYRIKNLIKTQVIKGYRTLLDVTKLDYQRMLIALKLTNCTDADEKKLIANLGERENVLSVFRGIGKWNVMIDACIKDSFQMREMIMSIKKDFSGLIKDMTTLYLFDEPQYDYFPEALLKEAKKEE